MTTQNILKILNLARTEGGYEDRISVIDQNNLHNLSLLDANDMNAFINVIGKIVRQYIFDTTFTREDNPFSGIYLEKIPYGMSVEDLYVDIIKGAIPAWDDDGSVALSKKLPNVSAIYHKINYENQYKVSTTYSQARTAFMSLEGVDSLITRILNQLNTAYEYDLYLQTIELISTAYNNNVFKIKGGYALDTEAKIKRLLKDFKTTVKDMTFMTDKYNPMKFTTKADRDNLMIITKPKYMETINVDYLAGVFNMDKVELQGRIIEVPDDYGFGTYDTDGDNVLFLVFDKRMLRVWNTLHESSSIVNPASLVTNTFLTTSWIFSYGTFFNAVAFTVGDAPEFTLTGAGDGVECTGVSFTVGGSPATKAAAGDEVTVVPTYKSGSEFKSATISYIDSVSSDRVTTNLDSTLKFNMPTSTSTGVTVNVIGQPSS